jgi:lipid A 3-O-deacylase
VAHNVFIEGNTFRDSAGVEARRHGYDVQLGIAAAWPGARVGFAIVERGREFEGQGSPDRFGQLALSLAY